MTELTWQGGHWEAAVSIPELSLLPVAVLLFVFSETTE